MDPKTVEKLEGKIEEAIAEIIVKMGVRKLPLLPSRHTMHLMAKAAIAVYEAAVENYDRGGLSGKRAGTNRLCPRATPGTIRSQDKGGMSYKDSDGIPESRYVAPSRYSLRTTALLCDSSLAA